MLVTLTANMIKPDFFFFTQMVTFGGSDLRDLELIYMDPFDAVVYFTFEFFLLPWIQPISIMWVLTFWWVYAAELTWFALEAGYALTSIFFDQYVD